VSKIEQLIDEIEVYIDQCKYQPLSNTKIIVNKEEIDELLRELRSNTPDEIKRYQKMISNKEAILNDAKQKAQSLINEATVQTNKLINEHEIMQQAYAQANEVVGAAAAQAQDLLDKATNEANQMKSAAVTYTDSLLAEVEQVLNKTIDSTTAHYESELSELANYSEMIRSNRAALVPPSPIVSNIPAQASEETNKVVDADLPQI
jgi:cell division septum initiation protein DivIVA